MKHSVMTKCIFFPLFVLFLFFFVSSSSQWFRFFLSLLPPTRIPSQAIIKYTILLGVKKKKNYIRCYTLYQLHREGGFSLNYLQKWAITNFFFIYSFFKRQFVCIQNHIEKIPPHFHTVRKQKWQSHRRQKCPNLFFFFIINNKHNNCYWLGLIKISPISSDAQSHSSNINERAKNRYERVWQTIGNKSINNRLLAQIVISSSEIIKRKKEKIGNV